MIAVYIVIIVSVVSITASILVSVIVNSKQDKLYNQMCEVDAVIRSKCMVREGGVHEPGVAQVVNGTLVIRTVLGRSFELPLGKVVLQKQTIGIGWYPWIGKAIFKLKAPNTSMLAIGVSRKYSEEWRNIFVL